MGTERDIIEDELKDQEDIEHEADDCADYAAADALDADEEAELSQALAAEAEHVAALNDELQEQLHMQLDLAAEDARDGEGPGVGARDDEGPGDEASGDDA